MYTYRSNLVEVFEKAATVAARASPRTSDVYDVHVHRGLLGFEELTSSEGFSVLTDKALSRARGLQEEVIRRPGGSDVIILCDRMSDSLCKVADAAEFIRVVHPDQEYREAARRACLKIGGFVEYLNTDIKLYHSLKKLESSESLFSPLDEETKQVAKLLLFDFEQSGVHLNSDGRCQALKLLEEHLVLGVAFAEGCHSAPLSLPDKLRDHGVQAVEWAKDHHHDSSVRENAYRLYYDMIPEQVDLMERMLAVRYELASLCGFQSFSHRALHISMIGSPERAVEFLVAAAERLKPLAEREVTALMDFKAKCEGESRELEPWDVGYYMYCMDVEIRELEKQSSFPLGHCMECLTMVFSSVFGLTLHAEDAPCGELWCSDVVKLTVRDDNSDEVGTIYCDLFARLGKHMQDSHFTIRCGCQLSDGSYQTPVIALVCNFPKHSSAVLSVDQLVNLFHEMGHALHSILGQTKYQHVSGTRCATDLAEVPSHLLEKFAVDPTIHDIITQDKSSQKPKQFQRVKEPGIALKTLGQVIYALTDLEVHGHRDALNSKSASEVHLDVMSHYWPAPFLPSENRLQHFSHLSSYGAKYYSYLLARAIRNRVWNQYFKGQPLNRESGDKMRQQLLCYGGSMPPRDILNNFLGCEPTVEELCDSLLEECL